MKMDELDQVVQLRSNIPEPADEVIERSKENLRSFIRDSAQPKSNKLARTIVMLIIATTLSIGSYAVIYRSSGEPIAAADELKKIAVIAKNQSLNPAGTVIHAKSIGMWQSTIVDGDGNAVTIDEKFARESWVAPDGSGRIIETRADQVSDNSFGANGLVYNDFRDWPSDPEEIKTHFVSQLSDTEVPRNVATFVAANEMLRESATPCIVRSSMLNMLAELPDIEGLGKIDDGSGRVGTGFALTSDYSGTAIQEIMIFDPKTSRLLGDRKVDLSTGRTISWASYEASDFVETIPPGGTPIETANAVVAP